MALKSLIVDKLLPEHSKLLEPLDVDQLLAHQLVHVHRLVQVSKLVLLLVLGLLSALFALIIQEDKLGCIRVLDWEALNRLLLLGQPL